MTAVRDQNRNGAAVPIMTFDEMIAFLTGCLCNPSAEHLAQLERVKAFLRHAREQFPREERARIWYLIGRVYFASEQYVRAYDAMSVCEKYVDEQESAFAFQVYTFLTDLAMRNEKTVHAQLLYRNVLRLLDHLSLAALFPSVPPPEIGFLHHVAGALS